MNIQKILEDDNLESRFDGLLGYVGEICGQPCGVIEGFDAEKAKQSEQELELSSLSIFISHHSNNHTAAVGPCVLIELFGNKFGWCLRIELQTSYDVLVYVEGIWWEIDKLEYLSPCLKEFMRGDGEVKGGVKKFLKEYFGREPELLTGSIL